LLSRHLPQDAGMKTEKCQKYLAMLQSSVDELKNKITALKSLRQLLFINLDIRTQSLQTYCLQLIEQLGYPDIQVELKENDLFDVDTEAIELIIRELVHNAICASGGESKHIRIHCQHQAQQDILIVSDQGCGIGEHELESIFDPYVIALSNSQQQASMGMGLAKVQALMHAHSGYAYCQSKLHQGTSLLLAFPRQAQKRHASVQ